MPPPQATTVSYEDIYHTCSHSLSSSRTPSSHTVQYAGLSSASPPNHYFDLLHYMSTHQHYLTIEELKSCQVSCWSCGCNWQEDHVSLDCAECGGYALKRPCPDCDGKCKQTWSRDLDGSHEAHKALWNGQCTLFGAKNLRPLKQQQQQPQATNIQDDEPLRMRISSTTGLSMVGNQTIRAAAKNFTSPKTAPDRVDMTDRSTNSFINPSVSSCCSSTPSSAAPSDEESDESPIFGEMS